MTQNMTPDMDEILDYDGVIENDGEGFATLPDNDEVTFTVTEVEKGRSKDGTKPQVRLKMMCESVAGHGRTTIIDYITLTKKSEWKLCEFFLALGMRRRGERLRMNWDIIGYTGRATVSLEKFTGRDGDERFNNKIKRYLEPLPNDQQAFDGVDPAFA